VPKRYFQNPIERIIKLPYTELTDAENSENQVWLEFSFKCNYISESVYNELLNESNEVGN
jgi:hypothetical protein